MTSGAATRVSVVVPVHNGERYLAEALHSILAQTYPVAEIVVVDDGSTDGTEGVARGFGPAVRYLYQNQRGAGTARNTGARAVQGTHLAFLDADDLWTSDKTLSQVQVLQSEPTLDAVFGQVRQFRSPELADERPGEPLPGPEVIPGYHPGAMLIRREAFERVGPFEAQWAVGEFLNWYLRASEQGLRTRMLEGVVMLRRIHAANTTVTRRSSYVDYVRVLKASLDRRRSAGREGSGPGDCG